MKSSLLVNLVYLDGQLQSNQNTLKPYTVYVNPYYVCTYYGNYVDVSKHYYNGDQRVATSLYYTSYLDEIPGDPEPEFGEGGGEANPESSVGSVRPVENDIALDDFTDVISQYNIGGIFLSGLNISSGSPPDGYESEYCDHFNDYDIFFDGEESPCPFLLSSLGENPVEDYGVSLNNCLCRYNLNWANLCEINCNTYTDVYWYHPDYLGNTEYVSDIGGFMFEHFFYSPFGEALVSQHANTGRYDTEFRFNGKEQDPETGLYYYGARYYNPSYSVWLSVDPHYFNYPTLTPYAYVANNPINAIDPDGRDIWELNKQGELALKDRTSDDFNIFLDADGNEIFRTNEQMSLQEGVSGSVQLDNFDAVLRQISMQERVYEFMEQRAEESGFDNSLLLGGISELKEMGDNYTRLGGGVDRNLAIDYITGKAINKPKVPGLDQYGVAENAYKFVTRGRSLSQDASSAMGSIRSQLSDTRKSWNNFKYEVKSGYKQMKSNLRHSGRPW